MSTENQNPPATSQVECPELKNQKVRQNGTKVIRLYGPYGEEIGRQLLNNDGTIIKEIRFPGHKDTVPSSFSKPEDRKFVSQIEVNDHYIDDPSTPTPLKIIDLTNENPNLVADELIMGDKEACLVKLPYNHSGGVNRDVKNAVFSQQLKQSILERAKIYGEKQCQKSTKQTKTQQKFITRFLENIKTLMKKTIR